MRHDVLERAEKYAKAHRSRKLWHRVVTCLAAVVVFCTTYALILPAITLERWQCGITEHTHTEECYTQVTSVLRTEPVCRSEALHLHEHTGECYDETGTLVCGYADFAVHEHNELCYDEGGNLWCPLPEITVHTHDESCFSDSAGQPDEPEEAVHVHTEDCYTLQCGALICTESAGGHIHGEECYVQRTELVCSLTEGEGHQHDENCFDPNGQLICSLEESEEHYHTEDCYEVYTDLICTLSEEPVHEHTDECYELERVLICELPTEPQETGENAGPAEDPEPSEPELICSREEIILHEHTPDCFDENNALICGKLQVLEHVHSEDCFQTVEVPVDTQALTCQLAETEGHTHSESCYNENGELTCQVEESAGHQHSALCYGTWELTCTLPEHVHTDLCSALTPEEQARVNEVIALIDGLPTSEEAEAALAAYDEAGDEDGFEAYYIALREQSLPIYINYEAMDPLLQEMVTNRDKLLSLDWIWSSMTLAVTDTVNVTAVNSHSYSASIIYHSANGMAVRDNTSGEKDYKWWYAVRIEEENGRLTVKQVETNDGNSKRDVWASGNGFVLLFHPNNAGSVSVSVGDTVTVSSDFWKSGSSSSYTGTVYGTVTFSSSSAALKPEKDNSQKLDTIEGADTRELIEVNLYDYNSSINTLYNNDHKYPGFQQDRGSTAVGSSFSRYSFNFGNNITEDLAAGIAGVTNAGGNINKTENSANSPISGAMLGTLGSDGQPALADGTSLGYLFSDSGYAQKQNSESINGLFQYHEETGAYTFNSRENHAQFNPDDDTFTLYRQIISSNFMMYPFGNFLPFNDIVKLSAQTSTIDRAYLLDIANSAEYKYNHGAGDEYGTLATQLKQFIKLMDNAYGTGWNASYAINKYFELSGIPRAFDQNEELLQNLYSIDYDEPTDFFFGMEMKMNLMQPKGGLTGNDGKQPMVFYFTGDDDVWVYIDGILFLDLSGIHRHVGGEIDFVNGLVKYYDLNVSTGDVSTIPSKVVPFSNLVSTGLNDAGTFEDYSTHSFNFYYIERGAGSGVCRMNFNFPLLRQNTISVSKELSVDEANKAEILGDPDFRFQILREGSNEPFIGSGVSYDILDADRKVIGSGTTGDDGIFVLKANQTAVFSGIYENSGRYFVRELLSADAFSQYGEITVNGSSTTTATDSEIVIDSDTFTGVDSPAKDVSDGSTVFHFNNQITFSKLGSLEISKILKTNQSSQEDTGFRFYVTLDGKPLPTGTEYSVGKQTRTVSEEGIITLAPDEIARISNILAGSRFTVQETSDTGTGAGYTVTYSGTGLKQESNSDGAYVSGTIKADSAVQVTVTNYESGASISIPGTKLLSNPDGNQHSFSFQLAQVTDASGSTLVQDGVSQTVTVNFPMEDGGNTASFQFTLTYLEKNLGSIPSVFYYKITENAENTGQVQYDPAVYVAEITVSRENGELTAALTNLWKNGAPQSNLSVSFINTLTGSLTIGKQVNGGQVQQQEAFSFTVSLTREDAPVSGTFSTVKTTSEGSENSTVTFDENGQAKITLCHAETLSIQGIPLGTSWSVTEDSAGGYRVAYQTDGAEPLDGNSGSGTISGSGSTIQFTNTAAYELPETGGAGTNLYTRGGLLLSAAAAFLLLYNHIRRRREEPFSS